MTAKSSIFTLALCMIPVGWLLVLIYLYYVPCFHSDEWTDTLPMMAHYLDGTLTFGSLYAFVGEHRLLFPHLLTLGLGALTHWDVRFELIAELVLAGLAAVNIALTIRQSGGDWRLMPVVCLLIFSPAGYENWMLGYQLCFWLAIACLTAIPWMAGTRWRYAGTGLLCFIASFSCASGLAAWVMALLLIGPWDMPKVKAELVRVLAWLTTALVSILLYFQGWSHRSPRFAPKHPLQHPVEATLFFMSYFGNPYSRGFWISESTMGQIAGSILFILFVTGTILAWRRKLLSPCLPWLALGFGAMLISAETTYGRFGSPVQESRYVPFAALFSIAVIFIFWQIKPVPILPGTLALLAILSAITCNPDWELQQHLFGLSRVKQQLVDVLDETNSIQTVTIVALVNPAQTIGELRTLEKHGWRTPHLLFDSRVADGFAQYGKRVYGSGMHGRAFLGRRPADAIIFTQDGAPFAMATPTTEGDWNEVFKPGQIDGIPQAWAYDATTQTAHPLSTVPSSLNVNQPAKN